MLVQLDFYYVKSEGQCQEVKVHGQGGKCCKSSRCDLERGLSSLVQAKRRQCFMSLDAAFIATRTV